MNTGLYYSLTVAAFPETTFDVVDFKLDEALSELFELNIRVSTKTEHDIDLDAQLLQNATLQIKVDGEIRRTIHGIVEEVFRDDGGFKRTFYSFKIRPQMWLLTLTQDSKIFHFKSVPDILDELLNKHGVQFNKQLMDPHSNREYTTQKRETDYDLFRRLASEEGIMFWFEEDQMFYSDSHLGMTKGQPLIYNPHPQSATKEYTIHTLNYGSRMRSNEVAIKDYRFSHPDVELKFKDKQGKLPVYSVYDSYGRFYDDAQGQQFAKYRTGALQAESLLGKAKSNCSELMPGKLFDITEHSLESMNDVWQVVRITHRGTQPRALDDEANQVLDDVTNLSNEFSFIPGRNDWRPPFIHKPQADGDEVATVVGPEGEEIYVNEDGAVKVHFHWNLYDSADQNASCWVRVVQNWNGDGFGFLATPRIGQEVVISYLNGDIDRPIITGTVYNGKNRPPLQLPAAKTQMTIKSKTHKGDGFNELRFEDENGKQEVFLHAQKDMNTKVLNDRSTHVLHDHSENVDNNQAMVVGVDQSLNVGNDQSGEIGNNQTLDVGNDQTMSVGNNQTETVGNNRSITVDSNDTLLVKNSQFETIAIAKTETIGAGKALSIGAAYQTTVGGMMNTTVGLMQAEEIGLNKSIMVGKSFDQTVNDNKTTTVIKNYEQKVGESKTVNVTEHVKFVVGESFEIVCGNSTLSMDKDGNISINGHEFSLGTTGEQFYKADGEINMKAKQILEN